MTVAHDIVPEQALDYDEIFRRGGANFGDEDFALCKCPHCGRVYLVEYEVDTLYLDPIDLGRRVSINVGMSGFECEGCGRMLPEHTPWIGHKAPSAMQVTWNDLAQSPWRWVTPQTRSSTG
jgi:predicted Fe-S protein YdhL (DUF1289 family)